MKLLSEVSQSFLEEIRHVFTVIDATLADNGSLRASAYGAIEGVRDL